MKSISTINPVNTEIQNVWSSKHTPQFSILKVGILVNQSVSLSFISLPALQTFWVTFLAKSNKRSTPASTTFTQFSHQSHKVHTANCLPSDSGERNEAQRRSKITFGRSMMQTLELLYIKGHVSGWSNVEQWRNQICVYSHCWLVSLVSLV